MLIKLNVYFNLLVFINYIRFQIKVILFVFIDFN